VLGIYASTGGARARFLIERDCENGC